MNVKMVTKQLEKMFDDQHLNWESAKSASHINPGKKKLVKKFVWFSKRLTGYGFCFWRALEAIATLTNGGVHDIPTPMGRNNPKTCLVEINERTRYVNQLQFKNCAIDDLQPNCGWTIMLVFRVPLTT